MFYRSTFLKLQHRHPKVGVFLGGERNNADFSGCSQACKQTLAFTFPPSLEVLKSSADPFTLGLCVRWTQSIGMSCLFQVFPYLLFISSYFYMFRPVNMQAFKDTEFPASSPILWPSVQLEIHRIEGLAGISTLRT